MNHQVVYDQLINKRLKSPATGYVERHHIVPRALGGSDDPSNLVVLTAREHWVAHLLLYKINPCQANVFACSMMSRKCHGRSDVKSSRMYQFIREEHAKHQSKFAKKHFKGSGNSQYGTMWICNIDLKQNKKISKTEPIHQDWVKGRNKWIISKVDMRKQQTKNKKHKHFIYIKRLYEIFIILDLNHREFIEYGFYNKSIVSLWKNFKKLGLKH